MTIFLAILAMLFGFAALYYGAEWLVAGAISIAKHLRISKVVAGVILVAFGTSAPELFVNSIAAVRGEASFALSNISGSNLANLLIGFGSCAVLSQLPIQNRKFRVEFIAYAVAPLVMFIIMFLNGSTLPGWSALLLLTGFAYYIYLTKSRMHTDNAEDEAHSDMPLIVGILWFIVGITLLYVGGEVTVRQAVKIGEALNISEAILGLTVVALGTSIPDITASIVAARTGEHEIAAGNLLGSNVFNILFVIPLTLLFSLLTGKASLIADPQVVMSYAVVTVVSLLFFLWVLKRDFLQRNTGYVMIGTYLAYMIFRVVQATLIN